MWILLTNCVHSQQENQPYQKQLAGGPCEGCEAVFEYGNKKLTATDTLPDFKDAGPKIKVTGIVFQPDGTTPAKDVIIYVYHTDQTGIYPNKGDETGWAKRHGYIRGWAKTGADGKYTFYTLKPGTYPQRTTPAHIHATIVEPNGKYYWIEEYLFNGDPLLAKNEISTTPRGGGSFVLSLRQEGKLLIADRDIILGKNIPGY